MRQRVSNKWIPILIMGLLLVFHSNGQQVLGAVRMERITPALFRVHYKLYNNDHTEINSTNLKIFRRRKGRVEEIFSADITGQAQKEGKGSLVYSWVPPPGTVESGDQLQAHVVLHYDKAVPRSSSKNSLPVARAGTFREIEIPLTAPLVLDGSASHDAEGKIKSFQWKQIAGPETLELQHPDSAIALIKNLDKEGTYAFELLVKDASGAMATDRLVLTVRSAPLAVLPQAVPEKPAKKETEIHKDAPSEKVSVIPVQPRAPLKGGPSNALINLLVPGLGHYYVSGDQYGHNRKKWPFAITALYALAAGGTVFYLLRSDDQYSKYAQLAAYREYQHDANGNVIGIRGGNEALANEYYNASRKSLGKAKILAGVAGGILVADFAYTLWKGLRNRASWKDQKKTGLFISSSGSDLAIGMRIKW